MLYAKTCKICKHDFYMTHASADSEYAKICTPHFADAVGRPPGLIVATDRQIADPSVVLSTTRSPPLPAGRATEPGRSRAGLFKSIGTRNELLQPWI